MKKSIKTQNNILKFLDKNSGVSSVVIAQYLGISRISVYTHLQKLIKSNDVFSKGSGKITRYFASSHEKTTYKNKDFYDQVLLRLKEEYEGINDLNLVSLSKDIIAHLNGEGIWSYGLRAFEAKIKKENSGISPDEELLQNRFTDFIYSYLEKEEIRKKYGLFSGTQSLKSVLSRYDMPVFINKLYFCELFSLMIGKLRCGEEIYWGKKLQNKQLLESGISYGLKKIAAYIRGNHVQYVVYTPPTIPRIYQFPNILRSELSKKGIVLKEIIAKKKESPQINFKPQKDTKDQERITNARASIIVEKIENIQEISEILILDDNFVTGATMNAIVEKINKQGYQGKITAITLTGSFNYEPGITDLEEI